MRTIPKRASYLGLAFTIGFTALVYEIYSTQVLFLFVPETTRAVTIAISSFLAGLASSSLLFSRYGRRDERVNLRLIWYMQVAVALYAFLLLQHYAWIPEGVDYLLGRGLSPALISALKFFIMWVYLFIPAFCMGGSFPLINGLFLKDITESSRDTGLVYFFDTLGSIIGALVTGFVLLPYVGLTWTCLFTVAVNLIIAAAIAKSTRQRFVTCIVGLLMAAIAVLAIRGTPLDVVRKPTGLSSAPNFSSLDSRFGKIVFQKQSAYGLITIGSGALHGFDDRVLFINYRPMCSSVDHASEADMGSIATAVLPRNAKVLNIGLGCGFTAHAVAQSPVVSALDIVEINPVVAEANKQYFADANAHVLEQKKTTLHIRDGAEYIRNTTERYDAILIDIEEPTVIYSSPLYTREYFALAKAKLRPGGVLALWAGNGSQEYAKVLQNTLQSVFAHVQFRLLDNSSFFTYFASDATHDYSAGLTAGEQAAIDGVLANKTLDINTLDNRALEKYYNINTFFSLPENYTEQFIRQHKLLK